MKIKKIVDLCKKRGMVYIISDAEGGGVQWLGDGAAFYPLFDAPRFDKESLCTIFDINEVQAEKILFRIEDKLPVSFNFDNNDECESFADESEIHIIYGGRTLRPIHTDEGIVFLNVKYLAPLSDADNVEIYKRYSTGDTVYFVAKVGYEVQAVIMPVDIMDKGFMESVDRLASHSAIAFKNKERTEK